MAFESDLGLNPDASPLVLLCVHKLLQSCPTPGDPMDGGPPGFSVHEDSAEKNSEWVALPLSRGSS